ncbi:hypothetical protein WMY93_033842 [Mugilogobius chulae]|uniref:Uncharacterized protein n=1 Tax=Mugilogobius chulae TaxID=88201 RepID=A0AAW0MQR3_9GOBI
MSCTTDSEIRLPDPSRHDPRASTKLKTALWEKGLEKCAHRNNAQRVPEKPELTRTQPETDAQQLRKLHLSHVEFFELDHPLQHEFFERTILCNSLSGSPHRRAGLTYLRRLESERRARNSLQRLHECLVRPLLLSGATRSVKSKRLSELCERVVTASVKRDTSLERAWSHNQRRKQEETGKDPSLEPSELCEEVYGFCKERYFPGESGTSQPEEEQCRVRWSRSSLAVLTLFLSCFPLLRVRVRVPCQVVPVLSPHSTALTESLLSPHTKVNGSVHQTEGESS